MNKDLDSRIVPNGEYREATNLSISRSESSTVGEFENVLGNSKISDLIDITGSNANVEIIGSIVDENGTKIGEHKGLYFYTLGQRQGLWIGGVKNRDEKALYVAGKDFDQNNLIVVQDNNHPLLFSSELKVSNINWLKQPNKKNITAKIRYRQEDQECEIHQAEGNLYVKFKNPQRAVTQGQFIVFYEDEICLGGGEIDI